VGNIPETQIAQAVETFSNESLTGEERTAAARQFVEFALAGLDSQTLEFVLKDKSVEGLLQRYGVDLSVAGGPDFSGDNLVGATATQPSGTTPGGRKFRILQ